MTLREHFKKNFILAYPVVIGQIGHIMVAVADTMMVGRVGVIPLAAATFAGSFIHVLLIFGVGVSYSITPLVAATNKEDKPALFRYLENGFALNLLLGLGLALIGLLVSQFLMQFGQNEQVAHEAKSYLIIVSFSLVPMMIFQTFRQYSEGLSNTFSPMVVSVLANLLNVFLNYLLIYGSWGFPEMGLAGAGYATLLSRVVMALLIFWMIQKSISGFKWAFDWAVMKRMLKIGVPSGLQYVFEIAAFAISAIMIGWISPEAQAAHQIAINLAAITYMAAGGLAAAATIRVGNQMGLQNKADLRLAGYTTMISVVMLMTTASLIFIIFRWQLAALYISDGEVQAIAARLLIIAAAFQLSDGMQAVGLGILRGLTDVKVPTLVTFFAYWLVALPVGYWLGFHWELGVDGIWYGLSFGLTVAAIMHFIRFRNLVARLNF